VAVTASAPPAPLGPTAALPVPLTLRAARTGDVFVCGRGTTSGARVRWAELPPGAEPTPAPRSGFGTCARAHLVAGDVVTFTLWVVPPPGEGAEVAATVLEPRPRGGFSYTRRVVRVRLPAVVFPMSEGLEVEQYVRAFSYLWAALGGSGGQAAARASALGLTPVEAAEVKARLAAAYRRLAEAEPGLFDGTGQMRAQKAVTREVVALDRWLVRRLGTRAASFFARVRNSATAGKGVPSEEAWTVPRVRGRAGRGTRPPGARPR
jgi:hypothetical protein